MRGAAAVEVADLAPIAVGRAAAAEHTDPQRAEGGGAAVGVHLAGGTRSARAWR